jgi:hypothetical protein
MAMVARHCSVHTVRAWFIVGEFLHFFGASFAGRARIFGLVLAVAQPG